MIQRQSQNVSLAHRPNAQYAGVGGNFRVELAVETPSGVPVEFGPYQERIKVLLDHQCLCAKPSSLEHITRLAAGEIFQAEVNGGRWNSLTVTELDRRSCTIFPDHSMRTTIKIRNLTLTVNGFAEAEGIDAYVDRVFASLCAKSSENEFIWGQQLFRDLAAGIPALTEVLVDLGRHRSLRLADDASALR